MIRRPPRSTRTDTLFPYTTLFRSAVKRLGGALARRIAGEAPILNQPGDGLGTLQAEDEAGKLEPCRGWRRTSRDDEAAALGLECETAPPGRPGARPSRYDANAVRVVKEGGERRFVPNAFGCEADADRLGQRLQFREVIAAADAEIVDLLRRRRRPRRRPAVAQMVEPRLGGRTEERSVGEGVGGSCNSAG